MYQDLITTLTYIKEILGASWVANVLGVAGGTLGAWTFIDNYILPFKPRIFLGGKISFEGKRESHLNRKEFYLKSIILPLEIGNHRNKYGFIHDFAIRIYSANELNPDAGVYYVSKILPQVPLGLEESTNISRTFFSPFAVLPKSKQSMVLEFSELTDMSPMTMSDSCEVIAEVYYQEYPTSKWKLIGIDRTLQSSIAGSDLLYAQSKFINKLTSRGTIKSTLPPIRVDMYKGISDRYFGFLISRIKSWSTRPFWLILQIAHTIYVWTIVALNSLYDICIRKTLLTKHAKKPIKTRITCGSPDLLAKTNSGLALILNSLQKLINDHNQIAEPAARVLPISALRNAPPSQQQGTLGTSSTESEHSEFSRNSLTLKVYKAGDANIVAQGHSSRRNFKFVFHIKQVRLFRSFTYWKLENAGPITLKSFALRVFDAFMLHSSY